MTDPNLLITLTAQASFEVPMGKPRPQPGTTQAEVEELKAGLLRLGGAPENEEGEPR